MICCTISDILKLKQDYPETSFAVQEIGGGVLLTFARTGARQPEEPRVAVQRNSEKILGLRVENELRAELEKEQLWLTEQGTAQK